MKCLKELAEKAISIGREFDGALNGHHEVPPNAQGASKADAIGLFAKYIYALPCEDVSVQIGTTFSACVCRSPVESMKTCCFGEGNRKCTGLTVDVVIVR